MIPPTKEQPSLMVPAAVVSSPYLIDSSVQDQSAELASPNKSQTPTKGNWPKNNIAGKSRYSTYGHQNGEDHDKEGQSIEIKM